uniref:Uncharacterized protein n=1 Tax=Ciona intestinalis TaxID=7719 RepID=H2XPV3_CIOIN
MCRVHGFSITGNCNLPQTNRRPFLEYMLIEML